MGGIIGALLVIAGDRLMPREFTSAHMFHIALLDFQILFSLSSAASETWGIENYWCLFWGFSVSDKWNVVFSVISSRFPISYC